MRRGIQRSGNETRKGSLRQNTFETCVHKIMFDKCQETGLFYITFQFKSTGVKNIPRCCRNTLLQCLLAHGLLNARKIVNKLKTTTTESKHTESQVPNHGPKGYRRFKNHQLHTIQRHSCSISRKKKALFPFQKVLGSECAAVWEQLRHCTEALCSSHTALESQKPDEFPGSQYGHLLSSS